MSAIWHVTYGHVGFGLKRHCRESDWTKVEGHECKGKTIFCNTSLYLYSLSTGYSTYGSEIIVSTSG